MKDHPRKSRDETLDERVVVVDGDTPVNASGHVQELDRNFSLLSITAVGIVTGNTWAALGGSIAVAIYNGGPPGVIYEFIAVSLFYWIVAACIAELASAVPSNGGVYQWATITAGRYGRPCGFFAGWWNFFAWIMGGASVSAIIGNLTVQMYATHHENFVPQKWHVFVAYLIITWACCCVVLFANSALPGINNAGLFFIIGGVFITIVVCAAMPSTSAGSGHASNAFVWSDWNADIGYPNGFVFLLGMLNGAYSVGVPDCVSHIAEEIPRPGVNVPKAIAAQMVVGLITAMGFMISIFYAISNLDDVLAGSSFPLAQVYRQATGSAAGEIGLLVCILLPLLFNCIGCYITTSRTLWALGRDGAAPFSKFIGHVSVTRRNPFNAILCCGGITTLLGCLYLGSTTAFNAFVGSFVVLSSASYLAAILPHLLSRRANITPGPFWMKGMLGFIMNAIACVYIVVFIVIFCFPYSLPTTASTMNYASLITGGLSIFIAAWYLFGCRGYTGPPELVVQGEIVPETMTHHMTAEKV